MPGIDDQRRSPRCIPGGVTALDALDLTIDDGEFFALLGPSGCGKTTLLRTIAGLEIGDVGPIRIGERDVTPLPPGDRNVAMVFQDYALYPHMTVRDNIAYPLQDQEGRTAPSATPRREAAGDSLSLDQPDGPPSGPALGRPAAARRPRPGRSPPGPTRSCSTSRCRTSTPACASRRARSSSSCSASSATTAVFVTHDQSEALALADRMAVMESGVIRQVGTPSELFHRPANLFVAGFIGSTPMNLIPGVVTGDGVDVGGGMLPLDAAPTVDAGRDVYLRHPPRVRARSTATGPITRHGRRSPRTSAPTSSSRSTSAACTIKATIQEGGEPQPGDTVGAGAVDATGAALRPASRGCCCEQARRGATPATNAPRASTSTSSSRSRRGAGALRSRSTTTAARRSSISA